MMTNETPFHHATSTLCNHLSTWTKHYATQNNIDLSHLPSPSLAFHYRQQDKDSDSSYLTYISCSSSMHTAQDDVYNNPPE